MNAPKPQKSLAGQTCPVCQTGKLHLVQLDHLEEVAQDNPLEVKGIWVDRCDNCGETFFPGETTAFIESVVAHHTEQLTPRELERIREDLAVDTQDEMSEILGLGTKTYHKWESGAQFPTRSMSYYIRVLSEFPDAFDWLRRRAWRNHNRIAHPQNQAEFADMFPELGRSPGSFQQRATQTRSNPARGLARVTFLIK